MIGFLEGTAAFTGDKFFLLNVNGVGYKIFASQETLQKISEIGAFVKIWTHQHVREDTLALYGFLQYAELELFEALIAISGIGPKGALGVLGVAPTDMLKKAIAAGDTSYLTRVSGIGRKTAEKIVLELKEKMAGKGVLVEAPELQHEADAIEALVAIGYSQREARDALGEVSRDITGAEARVREALKKIGRKR